MEKKGKRAQITLFIIIGLAIVILVYFIIVGTLSNQRQNKEINNIASDFQGTKDYMISCLQKKAISGSQIIMDKGGYDTLPQLSTKDYIGNTAYYYAGGENLAPSQAEVEMQLSSYLKEHADECIAMVNEAQKDHVVKSEGDNSFTINLQDNYVQINAKMPVSMTKTDFVHKEEDFSFNIPKLRLKELLIVGTSIAEMEKENPDFMCISCYSDLATQKNMTIDFMKKDGRVFFMVKDITYLINGEPIGLKFATVNSTDQA